jgi:hypothetical protein
LTSFEKLNILLSFVHFSRMTEGPENNSGWHPVFALSTNLILN